MSNEEFVLMGHKQQSVPGPMRVRTGVFGARALVCPCSREGNF